MRSKFMAEFVVHCVCGRKLPAVPKLAETSEEKFVNLVLEVYPCVLCRDEHTLRALDSLRRRERILHS